MNDRTLDGVSIPGLELKILGILWTGDGPVGIRRILESWSTGDAPGYTTVLKKLQVMEGKGLVGHERQGKAYAYFPKVGRDQVTNRRFRGILDTVFFGDRLDMAAAFLRETPFTRGELDALRALIDETEDSDG